MKSVPSMLLATSFLHLASGCGSGDAKTAAPSAQAPLRAGVSGAKTKRVVDPSWPAAKRIIGTWRMNVMATPDTALPGQLRTLKVDGKADQARVEYRITDAEFILDSYGAIGRSQQRWSYEIVSEAGDELMLRRSDLKDLQQNTRAVVTGDRLVIGFVPVQTVLDRIE